jgi:hypothetical protein
LTFKPNFLREEKNSELLNVRRSEPRSTPVIPDEIVYSDSPDSSLYGSEDEEQEDVSQYRRGGYHPIHLG